MAACNSSAYEVPLTFLGTNMPSLDFHGFASQGLLTSSDYDYLGYTKSASLKFTEAGVNVAMNPFPHTRITAQGFLFDVGNVGEYDLSLDYAQVDYNFSDAFGIRAGRIIRPEGIYNSVQSIDLTRTSVLLPQGLYDSRWRDFTGSVDGGSVYGDIGLSKAGSLSYEIYGGMVNLSEDGGIAREVQGLVNDPPYTVYKQVNGFPMVGFQLWWNTALDGFRVGVGGYQAFGFSYDYWINPKIGGPGAISSFIDASTIHPSLEYVYKNWTFQAEYKLQYYASHNEVRGNNVPNSASTTATDAWYVGAAYRFNKWLEVGTYYTEDYADANNRDGAGTAVPSDAYQKDLALSFRFDPKPWWILKVEGQYIHGTALLDDNAANPVRNNDGWFMLALKTTVSF